MNQGELLEFLYRFRPMNNEESRWDDLRRGLKGEFYMPPDSNLNDPFD